MKKIPSWKYAQSDIIADPNSAQSPASENKRSDAEEKMEMMPLPVERLHNNIFFYSELYRESGLMLNREIKKANNEISINSINNGVPPYPINLYVQSFGGILFSGFSSMDAIIASKAPVITIIDGCAASAATLLTIVGKERYITEHSYILIHQLFGFFMGTYEQQKDDMENSSKFMETIKGVYKKYTKLPMKRMNEILKHDLWLTAKEAKEYGLVDDIR